MNLLIERDQEVDNLLRLARNGFHVVGETRTGRLLDEIGRELLGEFARIRKRILAGRRIDEEIERIDYRHIGEQIDGDAEFGGLLRKHETGKPVAVRVLLPIHEMLGGCDLSANSCGLQCGSAAQAGAG